MQLVDPQLLSPKAVAALRDAAFTYGNVGGTGTFDSGPPSGYAHLLRQTELGSGASRFDEVVQTLLGWDMHRRAGLNVQASDPTVVDGAVAILRLGIGRLSVPAPVRVVDVVDEPLRKGFA
ncbi:DUF1990 family protein [Tessaracoccus sp. ZS01]|uniref:DUF1990 family protein n=1 Tax=Tessaracoccus sp. ZS01 TaxID=1906324 RepID=UPI00096C807E|nr:DUF1990 family protein [Tessaracoccus sp. ZS01]OMG55776.1 hypothetical protein BJN44_08765 [Tessaracoccus sp. ZS01]